MNPTIRSNLNSMLPRSFADLTVRAVGCIIGILAFPAGVLGQAVLGQAVLAKPVSHQAPTPVQYPATNQPAAVSPPVAPKTPDSIQITPDDLIARALAYSAQVKAIRTAPAVTATSIIRSQADFDWTAFWDTTWDDLSDPVGSALTTGGPNRSVDRNLYGNAGLRRRNIYGGEFDIYQRLGHQNTNSRFFVPNNQGSARLTISYSHPLLRGKGKAYNRSLICLAYMDTNISRAGASKELQDHLIEVIRAYWSLYQERKTLELRRELQNQLNSLLTEIYARRNIDTFSGQVARANSAVSRSRATLVRAGAGIKFAEARIRALVNDPALGGFHRENVVNPEGLVADCECPPLGPCLNPPDLIPSVAPAVARFALTPCDAMESAVRLRPELVQALNRIKQAGIECQLTKNELLPQLNLVTSVYVAGLRGQSNVTSAIGDQFRDGRPGYSLGLQYEFPIGNRAARARHREKQLELYRLQNEFRATMELIVMEATNAIGDVKAAEKEIALRQAAVQAADTELASLISRWRNLIQNQDYPGLVLDDVLRAQERVVEVKLEALNSSIAFNLAVMELQRSMGTFLQMTSVPDPIYGN